MAVALTRKVADHLFKEAAAFSAENHTQPMPRSSLLWERMAAAAVMIHLEYLETKGYRLAPPNTCLWPQSAEEAEAMIRLGREFLAAKGDD